MIWHPFTQSYGNTDPIKIVKAQGVYLYTQNNEKIIDAISSWWTNLHGHCHPYIAQKIHEQVSTLDHVIFAGFTHPKAEELAEKLLDLLPKNFSKIFFSDDGSTSVEVALKMALQYWHNKGINKKEIIAFKEGYHGDTFGAMAVGSRNQFTTPFESLLFKVKFIDAPLPGKEKECIAQLKNALSENTAAFLFEPLLMGTAGMKTYDATILAELISLCSKNNVLTIADEVLTGFYRTGTCFAIEKVNLSVDIVCLSKGITGGTMALGVTACTANIYNAFVSEDKFKTFFHGHSYTGNPIACAAACASIDLLNNVKTKKSIDSLCKTQKEWCLKIAKHKAIFNARNIGTINAFEIKTTQSTSYFNNLREHIYTYFLNRKILLRPLGNVIYVLPPYCITKSELKTIYNEIILFLNELAIDE